MQMLNYSTTARCRLEAWFIWNATITDPTIQALQDQSTSIITGIVSKRYDLASMLSDSNFLLTSAGSILARCEELLTAWHLLNKDYDIQDQDATSNGDKKISDAYKILEQIMSGDIVLTDTRYNGAVIVSWTWNTYPTLGASGAWQMYAYPTDDADRDFTKDQQR